MVHDSRQVVLGLRVEQVVSEADPVNCHPPALAITQPPAATEFDVTSSFLRAENFQTRDELIKWVRARGVELRFAIVIVNSDYGDGKRKQKLVLGCERGGSYKRTSKKLKFEETGTRKCGCPFKLRGYFLASKEWKLTVVNGTHNHDFDRELDAHQVCGRLKPEEMKVVAELTKNLVPPRNIMTTLKERDPDNTTNKKQLYNARHRLRAKARGPRSEMQHLFHCLEEKNYVFKSRSEGDSQLVQDLFFAHPTSVALFNTFPSVLLMDSTYKTNRYGRPLFEMVGCTSTGNTFNVAFAIIKNEKIDNFTWALQHCRSLLTSPDLGPKVTVTDRDTALMNAVETVFPDASPLVCRYHVLKNVVGKCKTLCKTRDGDEVSHSELVQGIMDRFEAVLESQTEECYVQSLVEFRKVCEKFPRFLNYVEKTVLDTDRTKVVRAWTDHIMHFGNTTTNRAESSHGQLKRFLTDGNGDFMKVWEAIEKMLICQFSTVKTAFGHSLNVEEHRFGEQKFLYALLIFKISRKAMDIIFHEAKRSKECGMDPKKCGCVVRRSYGLPCACVIAKKIRNKLPIRLDEINVQWKKLVIDFGEGVEEEHDDYSCVAEFEAIKERLTTVDVSMKAEIRDKLRELAFPATTTLTSPVVIGKPKVVKKKGAGVGTSTEREKSDWEHANNKYPDCKVSQDKTACSSQKSSRLGKWTPTQSSQVTNTNPFTKLMPQFMQPYIEDVVDVVGDGYCGYRVVALHENGNEDDYELVKLNMIREIKSHRKLYENVFGGKDRVDYILGALHPCKRSTRHGVAPLEKWLTFPDMGHVIATYYNRIVVELTSPINGVSETFFPLRSKPPSDPESRILCLGLIPGHFIQVKLKPGAILPKPAGEWRRYCTDEAMAWEYPFMDRMAMFEKLMDVEREDAKKKRKIKVKNIVGIGSSKDNPLTCYDSE